MSKPVSTVKQKLDEILGRPSEMMNSWQIEALLKAKADISTYIDERCREARIEELEKFEDDYDGGYTYAPNGHPESLSDRLAQLKEKK